MTNTKKKKNHPPKGQTRLSLTLPANASPAAIYGPNRIHIELIEKETGLKIEASDLHLTIIGGNGVERRKVKDVIRELAADDMGGLEITEERVMRAIEGKFNKGLVPANQNDISASADFNSEAPAMRMKNGTTIEPRNKSQALYLKDIFNNTVTFGEGPAGTGKTFLAVAAAVFAYDNDPTIKKIILTRPAVEAGEKLGFLPGDLKDKIDPYLRPLYDALIEMKGAATIKNMIDKGQIEISPLAYMRGRTLKDSFVVLDEAQNTTASQMKMFLTRLGENSKMVINGDASDSQNDLPPDVESGFKQALEALKDSRDQGIAIHKFSSDDVVRHPVVAHIVQAYEKLKL